MSYSVEEYLDNRNEIDASAMAEGAVKHFSLTGDTEWVNEMAAMVADRLDPAYL